MQLVPASALVPSSGNAYLSRTFCTVQSVLKCECPDEGSRTGTCRNLICNEGGCLRVVLRWCDYDLNYSFRLQ